MVFLQRFLLQAARRLAADPRARDKAAELFEPEIKPRAKAAAQKAKPKIAAAKAEIRNIASETDPLDNPAEFAGRLTRRIIEKVKGK